MHLNPLPFIREREHEEFNYYLLSRDEADELMLLTDDLVDRANRIMVRVMRIQDFLATQYAAALPVDLEPDTE